MKELINRKERISGKQVEEIENRVGEKLHLKLQEAEKLSKNFLKDSAQIKELKSKTQNHEIKLLEMSDFF